MWNGSAGAAPSPVEALGKKGHKYSLLTCLLTDKEARGPV